MPRRFDQHDPDFDPLAPECGDQLVLISKAEAKRLIAKAVYLAVKDIWDYVLEQTEQITVIGEKMAKYEEEFGRINDATNALAAKVEELRNRIDSDDPQVEAILNDLESRLRGIAADPENPVPDPEPEPEPVPDEPA